MLAASLIKAMLPEQMKIDRKDLKVVAIMPCTAKKFEAQRPELSVDGDPDVDHAPDTEAPPAGREGLPATFRMRADSHYVDLLASRAPVPAVQMIAIKDIAAEPVEPRDLEPLVESIRSLGVVQPLIVRRRKGQYALIAGARGTSALLSTPSSPAASSPSARDGMKTRRRTVPSGARPAHLKEEYVQAPIVRGSSSATRKPWPVGGVGNSLRR